MALATAAYAVLGIARHRTYRSTGFDLGLFDQVLWHAGRLERPASTLKGLHWILGDHLSPALALLAPAGWLGPEGLIAAQALVVCLAAFPIAAFARPRVGEGGALALAGAYLLFGGVQEALAFDVHEVALAPPAIALAVLWADRGQWRRATAAVLFLLLVKEDLALLVVAFGGLFAVLGRRRLGALVAAAGAAWFVLAVGVVIPAFAEGMGYAYGQTGSPLHGLGAKLRTGAYLLGAFGLLWVRSPVALLAVPLIGVRVFSAEPKHWTLEDHYTLTVAPVLALAAADALGRLTGRRDAGATLLRRAPLALFVLALLLTPAFPLRDLSTPARYRVDPAYAGAAAALARIPPGASVVATNRLVPHLDRRDDVRLLGPGPPRAAWVAAATGDPAPEGSFPLAGAAAVTRRIARLRGYEEVARASGGVVVLRRTR